MTKKLIICFSIVSILIASCSSGTVSPAPTATAPATIEPTATSAPTVTATPIPTIDVDGRLIPDPHFSNLELFELERANAPIPQLVHALHMAGVEVTAQDIRDGLIYKAVSAKNGDADIVVITSDIPTTLYDEGNIPLFIYMRSADTKEYSWNPAYLKDFAGLHNILMGVVIDGLDGPDPLMFDHNFNMVTMTWSSVDVSLEIMDRDTNHRLSLLADKKLKEVMWFHLGDIPLADKEFNSVEEAVEFSILEMDRTIQKYKDEMTIVTVYNEVNPGSDPVYKLWKKFGDQFIIESYEYVREALPGRKIIINNSFNDHKSLDGSTYPYTMELLNLLKPLGLIDAVGMEMHQAQSPYGVENPLVVDEAVEVMRSFGVPVYVTELDVNQTYMTGTEQEKLITQANIFEDVVIACVRSGVCEMINFWGSTDQSSWYEFSAGETNAEACIFDDDGTPKIAYYAVLRGLLEGY